LTVYFKYPGYVKGKGPTPEVIESNQTTNKYMILKIHESTNIYNSLVNSCKENGFIVTDTGSDWNLLWTGYIPGEFLRNVNKFQRINHFPNSHHLGRKDFMWKNIYKMQKIYGREYDISPKTYIFPQNAQQFSVD